MRSFFRCLPLLFLLDCGPLGECSNPNVYRILGWEHGAVFERTGAKIVCHSFSDQSECGSYTLVAGDISIAFPRAAVGQVLAVSGGTMTITKRIEHPTVCANGNYYTDYSGTLSGTFSGHTITSGAFYALETK